MPLIIFICLALFIVVAIEVRERKRAKSKTSKSSKESTAIPADCCGEHLVCERETLLNPNDTIVYYDDEDLDQLADKNPDTYTEQQKQALSEVFYSLKAEDVAGWCRSLQLRHIELPQDIREEALLILREQRQR